MLIPENGPKPRRRADDRRVPGLLPAGRGHHALHGRVRQQLLTDRRRRAPQTPRLALLLTTLRLLFYWPLCGCTSTDHFVAVLLLTTLWLHFYRTLWLYFYWPLCGCISTHHFGAAILLIILLLLYQANCKQSEEKILVGLNATIICVVFCGRTSRTKGFFNPWCYQ